MGCGCSGQRRVSAAQKGTTAQADTEPATLGSIVKPADNTPQTPVTEAGELPDQDQLAGEQPPRKQPPPSPTRSNLSAMSPVSLPEADGIPWKAPAAEPGKPSGGGARAAIGGGRQSDGDGDSDSGGGRPSEKGVESSTTVVDSLPGQDAGRCKVGSSGREDGEAEEREERPNEARLPRLSDQPLPQIAPSRGSTEFPATGQARPMDRETDSQAVSSSQGEVVEDSFREKAAGTGDKSRNTTEEPEKEKTRENPAKGKPKEGPAKAPVGSTVTVCSSGDKAEVLMVAPATSATTSFTPKAISTGQPDFERFERSPRTSEVVDSPPAIDRASGSDGDSLPPKQEARPALAAALSDSDQRAAASGILNETGRRVDRPRSSEVGEFSEPIGMVDSLLDAEEEDFMDSLLMDE